MLEIEIHKIENSTNVRKEPFDQDVTNIAFGVK